MTVIGIDPGSRIAGFGVVRCEGGAISHVENGVIRLNVKMDLSRRLLQLSDELKELFSRYQPELVAVEKVFLGKNVSSAFTLGHARGIVLSECARVDAQVEEYAPRVVKKGVAGHGGAEKMQVQNFLRSIFGITEFVTEDASDALALALHGARQWNHTRKLSQQGVDLR